MGVQNLSYDWIYVSHVSYLYTPLGIISDSCEVWSNGQA